MDGQTIYATKDYVDKQISVLDRRVDDSHQLHQANFDKLTILFEGMQTTFAKLDTTLTKLTDSQERTNDELKRMAVKNVEIEMRQKNVEADMAATKQTVESFGLSRKSYVLDALKVVTTVLIALIGLAGTIITVGAH